MINDDTMDNVSKTHTETLSAVCRQTHTHRHTHTLSYTLKICVSVVTGSDY